MSEITISLTREQAEKLEEVLMMYDDEGPGGEGWKSPLLVSIQKAVGDAVNIADGVPLDHDDTAPDWSGTCDNCGASPIVPVTGLCGPCTFGEADTAGGNW